MNLLQLFWEYVLLSKCKTLKKMDIIQDYKLESNKVGVIDLYIKPKQTLQKINIDITILPSGITSF